MRMVNRTSALAIFGAAVLWVLAGTAGNASTFSKATYLWFNDTILVAGTTLPAGAYVFELANPDTGRNIVRVSSRDRSKHVLVHTRRVLRPGRLREGLVTLGEARPGSPRPITAWFPQGENSGYQFVH